MVVVRDHSHGGSDDDVVLLDDALADILQGIRIIQGPLGDPGVVPDSHFSLVDDIHDLVLRRPDLAARQPGRLFPYPTLHVEVLDQRGGLHRHDSNQDQ